MVLVFGAAGGAGAYAASRVRTARGDRRERAEQLEEARRLADEDVTVFGEQLQRLGDLVEGHELDEETRHDYQLALDAYEHAKFDAPRLREVDQISSLVDTLASGRYSIVCVRARLAGEPVPEMRLPCFFNPQHGPSSRNVMWTSPRTGTRTVPACSRCATQLAAREKPEVRTVSIGGRRVPYWEAGRLDGAVQPRLLPRGLRRRGQHGVDVLPARLRPGRRRCLLHRGHHAERLRRRRRLRRRWLTTVVAATVAAVAGTDRIPCRDRSSPPTVVP